MKLFFAKLKELEFNDHSIEGKLSIDTLMEDVKAALQWIENLNVGLFQTQYHLLNLFYYQFSDTMMKILDFSTEYPPQV